MLSITCRRSWCAFRNAASARFRSVTSSKTTYTSQGCGAPGVNMGTASMLNQRYSSSPGRRNPAMTARSGCPVRSATTDGCSSAGNRSPDSRITVASTEAMSHPSSSAAGAPRILSAAGLRAMILRPAEAGRTHARFVATDLAAAVTDLASTFCSAIERAGLALSVRCERVDAPVWMSRRSEVKPCGASVAYGRPLARQDERSAHRHHASNAPFRCSCFTSICGS